MRGTPPQKGDCPPQVKKRVLFTLHHDYRKKTKIAKSDNVIVNDVYECVVSPAP